MTNASNEIQQEMQLWVEIRNATISHDSKLPNENVWSGNFHSLMNWYYDNLRTFDVTKAGKFRRYIDLYAKELDVSEILYLIKSYRVSEVLQIAQQYLTSEDLVKLLRDTIKFYQTGREDQALLWNRWATFQRTLTVLSQQLATSSVMGGLLILDPSKEKESPYRDVEASAQYDFMRLVYFYRLEGASCSILATEAEIVMTTRKLMQR